MLNVIWYIQLKNSTGDVSTTLIIFLTNTLYTGAAKKVTLYYQFLAQPIYFPLKS